MTDRLDNLAVVLLAHADTDHLTRLINCLDGASIFLHWDARSDRDPLARASANWQRAQVHRLPSLETRLASWSLVAAELVGLRTALERSTAEHIAVMSGADYPLVGRAVINEALASWRGRTWVRNMEFPYPLWNSPIRQDGGMWRWRWHFPTWHGQPLMYRQKPLCVPGRRRLPGELALRASPQWKIYDRRQAQLLLNVLDDHPELPRLGRRMFIPDEGFLTSIMASPAYFGDAALQPNEHSPWYVSWPTEGRRFQHPHWMTSTDVERIAQRRRQPRETGNQWTEPLFARKIGSRNAQVADRIETELWSCRVS